MSHSCRHCGSSLNHQVIDLGHQPPSNAYLSADQLGRPELTYPLRVLICTKCWLVQLPAHAAAEDLFTPDYAYFSSTSSSWCAHAERYGGSDQAAGSWNPQPRGGVGSNDGYLLEYVQQLGISCLKVSTRATAEAARIKGIPTLERFFDSQLAEALEPADLVVANNVLFQTSMISWRESPSC